VDERIESFFCEGVEDVASGQYLVHHCQTVVQLQGDERGVGSSKRRRRRRRRGVREREERTP
jgi:hypothetical protein